MSDLFKEKADNWDARPMSQILSEGVGKTLLDNVEISSGQSVMDFGAGTGLLCGHVAPKVKRVVAVDISPAMLERLAQKVDLQGKVETICQDILKQPLSEEFDLIISAMALHHVKDTEGLLSAFAGHLAVGGRVALADLDKEDGSFHPADVQGVYHHGFDRDELLQLLEAAGFSDVEFVTALEVERDGGSYPIFLVTARK